MSTAREILTSEDIDAQAQLLLSLLSDAAAGRDLFGVATDVIQVVLASGAGTAYTKKLAYDLCKLVPLSESDCDLLLIGIKTDVGSPFPDTQMAALQFLPSLPGSQLFAFLDRGQVSTLVEPCLYSGTPEVRSAAAITLARILLNSEVLAAAAASHGMTSTFQDWWELLSDGLVDPSTRAVGGAVAAVNLLLAAADRCREAGVKEPPQVLVVKLATRVGEGIAAGLGPALLQFRDLSPGLQVEVAELLVHLGKQAVREGAGSAGAEVTLASVGQQLVGCCGSINPAVRMEAAKGLLSLTRSLRLAAPLGNSLGPPPPVWATSAVAGLLGLKDRQYVEAALNDIVGTVAEHLEELQVGARMGVVKKLMPMVGALPSLQSRVSALVLLWEGLLQLHTATMQAKARGDAPAGAPTLTSFLSDPSIKDLLEGVQAPAGFSAPPTPDHPPSDTAHTPPKQELKRALSLEMFRPQASSTPSSLPSPSTPMVDSKPQLPLTFKHEVTCTLLCVLAAHPSAFAAASLAPRVLEDGPAAATREVAWRESQAAAVHWLSAATAALSSTTACVSWEPYMSPASLDQMSSAASPQSAPPAWLLVNFTSVPADAWLKLQATAAHVLRALLRSLGHPSMAALLRANQSRTLDRLHPADNGSLAKAFRDASVSLQSSVKKLLTDWEELALTVRPRVLWVAAYSLELPALLDDTWKRVVGALESLLLVGPLALSETHLKDLAVASMAGCLYPSVVGLSDSQVAGSGSLAGAFARAAQMASTSPSPRGGGGGDLQGMLQLAELAETSMDGLQVGLQVLQQLVYLLDDALHTPDVASGTLLPPAPVLAAKLQALTRRLILAPTITPDIRNVCRRLLKTLSAFDDLDPQVSDPTPPAPDTDPDTPTSSPASPTKLPNPLASLAPANGFSDPPPPGPHHGGPPGQHGSHAAPMGVPLLPPPLRGDVQRGPPQAGDGHGAGAGGRHQPHGRPPCSAAVQGGGGDGARAGGHRGPAAGRPHLLEGPGGGGRGRGDQRPLGPPGAHSFLPAAAAGPHQPGGLPQGLQQAGRGRGGGGGAGEAGGGHADGAQGGQLAHPQAGALRGLPPPVRAQDDRVQPHGGPLQGAATGGAHGGPHRPRPQLRALLHPPLLPPALPLPPPLPPNLLQQLADPATLHPPLSPVRLVRRGGHAAGPVRPRAPAPAAHVAAHPARPQQLPGSLRHPHHRQRARGAGRDHAADACRRRHHGRQHHQRQGCSGDDREVHVPRGGLHHRAAPPPVGQRHLPGLPHPRPAHPPLRAPLLQARPPPRHRPPAAPLQQVRAPDQAGHQHDGSCCAAAAADYGAGPPGAAAGARRHPRRGRAGQLGAQHCAVRVAPHVRRGVAGRCWAVPLGRCPSRAVVEDSVGLVWWRMSQMWPQLGPSMSACWAAAA